MSEMALRSLIAHAVVDNNLCAKLLDGQREQVLEQFVLQQIRAASLQGFAAQLDAWLKTRPIVAIGAE